MTRCWPRARCPKRSRRWNGPAATSSRSTSCLAKPISSSTRCSNSFLRGHGIDVLADELERDLVGRNVLNGRWTFQVVEEFDDGYWTVFRTHERAVRDALVAGRRHVYEAEMKERRRTPGHPAHGTTDEGDWSEADANGVKIGLHGTGIGQWRRRCTCSRPASRQGGDPRDRGFESGDVALVVVGDRARLQERGADARVAR